MLCHLVLINSQTMVEKQCPANPMVGKIVTEVKYSFHNKLISKEYNVTSKKYNVNFYCLTFQFVIYDAVRRLNSCLHSSHFTHRTCID